MKESMAQDLPANINLDQNNLKENKVSEIDELFQEFENLHHEMKDEEIDLSMIISRHDSGGQPAFLEMLPALTTGPAMYLIFSSLVQELRKQHTVKFRFEGEEEDNICPDYTYTPEEVLFTALASIEVFSLPDEEFREYITKEDKDNSQTKDSITILLGTFEDEAKKAEIDVGLEKCLQEQLPLGNGLVEYNKRDPPQVLFHVNNSDGGEEEVKRYQKEIKEIIEKCLKRYNIPVPWFMLGMCLKFIALKKEKWIMSIDDCRVIGEKLKMNEEEVKSALKFLHKYIGLVMYFPSAGDEYLSKHVICDPQVVFSTMSEQIFKVYSPTKRIVDQKAYQKFKEEGLVTCSKPEKTKSEADKHSNEDEDSSKDGLLTFNSLMKLLAHLNIVAPVDASTSAEYFLPAILKVAPESDLKLQDNWNKGQSLPEPLIIKFKTSFLPLGLFCGLIAKLYSTDGYDIIPQYGVKKNMVTFRTNKNFDVKLISWPRFCEVRICSSCETYSIKELNTCYPEIRESICAAINNVIKTMSHSLFSNASKKYFLGFKCPRHKGERLGHESIAGIDIVDQDNVPREMVCSDECNHNRCKVRSHLSPQHTMWYAKPTCPSITSQPVSSLKVGERKEISLTVTAKGSSPLIYHWTRDQEQLQDNIHYSGSSTNSLLIKQAHVKLRGQYCCRVSNKVGEDASALTNVTIADLQFSRDFNFEELAVWLEQNKISGAELQLFRDQKIDGETFLTLPTDKCKLVNELRSPDIPLGAKRQLVILITEACKVSGNINLEKDLQTGLPPRIESDPQSQTPTKRVSKGSMDSAEQGVDDETLSPQPKRHCPNGAESSQSGSGNEDQKQVQKTEHPTGSTDFHSLILRLKQATSESKFRQLKLAAWCVGLSPKNLDEVRDISDLYSSLKAVFGPDNATSILYLCLKEVQIDAETVRKLPFNEKGLENWRQKQKMKFALMVIGVCNQIAGEGCKRFIDLWKDDIHQTSKDIETLLTYLFQSKIVQLDNVKRLKEVLGVMENRVCIDMVENYQCSIKPLRQETPQDLTQQHPLQQNLFQQSLFQQDIFQQDHTQQHPLQQDLLHQDLLQRDPTQQDPLQLNPIQPDPPQQDSLQQYPVHIDPLQPGSPQQDHSQQDPLPIDPLQLDLLPYSHLQNDSLYRTDIVFDCSSSLLGFTSEVSSIDFENGVQLSSPMSASPSSKFQVKPAFASDKVFVLPDGIEAASPTFLISTSPEIMSDKVTLTIEHWVNTETEDEAKNLVFLVADSKPSKEYRFKVVDVGDPVFKIGERSGSISTDRFSFWIIGFIKKLWNQGAAKCYTVRLYKSPDYSSSRVAIIFISILHSVYIKHLDRRVIPLQYPEVSTNDIDKIVDEPVYITGDEVIIECSETCDYTVELDRTSISKVNVDLPMLQSIDPWEINTYPPKIVCQFTPLPQDIQRTSCSLTFHGLSKPVTFNVTLPSSVHNSQPPCPTINDDVSPPPKRKKMSRNSVAPPASTRSLSILNITALQNEFKLTDQQIDCPIEERDLFYLGGLFGPWRSYTGVPGLGLSRGEQHTIHTDRELINNQRRSQEALKTWQSHNPLTATFRKHLNIVLELNDEDVAKNICQYMTS